MDERARRGGGGEGGREERGRGRLRNIGSILLYLLSAISLFFSCVSLSLSLSLFFSLSFFLYLVLPSSILRHLIRQRT